MTRLSWHVAGSQSEFLAGDKISKIQNPKLVRTSTSTNRSTNRLDHDTNPPPLPPIPRGRHILPRGHSRLPTPFSTTTTTTISSNNLLSSRIHQQSHPRLLIHCCHHRRRYIQPGLRHPSLSARLEELSSSNMDTTLFYLLIGCHFSIAICTQLVSPGGIGGW